MTVPQRTTRQRVAIADFVGRQSAFMTAQQIHDGLRAIGERISLTTVYRNLTSLAEQGHLDALRTPEGEVAYRSCPQNSGHHHHLICRVCGNTVEVQGRAIETWIDDVAAEHGFVDVAHNLEIFGLCSQCVKAP